MSEILWSVMTFYSSFASSVSIFSFNRRLRWATMPVSVLPKQRAMAKVLNPVEARQE